MPRVPPVWINRTLGKALGTRERRRGVVEGEGERGGEEERGRGVVEGEEERGREGERGFGFG